MGNVDERIADYAAESMNIHVDWKEAFKGDDLYSNEEFMKAARAAMEPMKIMEDNELFDVWETWTNDNVDSWVGFIKNLHEGDPDQENWHRVVKFIAENGY